MQVKQASCKNKGKEMKFQPVLLLDGLQLKLEECVKFLGMHVDNALSWSYHVDALCKKLCSGRFVLRNIVKMASESVTMSV